MRELIRKLYGAPDDMFSKSRKVHENAADLMAASAETTAALVRNGVSPDDIRDRVFGEYLDLAEPFPVLRELVEMWLDETEDRQIRLDELHDYNVLMQEGVFREGANDGSS